MRKRKLLLKHHLCPGDITCTTSLVRDLHFQYGDRVEIGFDTNHKAVYAHNPYVKQMLPGESDVETIVLGYLKGLTESKAGTYRKHFLTYFYKDFFKKTGLEVQCTTAKPDLHLSEYHKRVSPISGRYWLVFAGGKSDFTVKLWETERYQHTVDRLRDFGLRFAQSGATKPSLKPKNIQPRLENVTDLLGWGGVEEFLWQIYHAEGVICPITAAMHIAAGFDKPCVVVAGGREEWWWEAYTNDGQFPELATPVSVPHKYLHTIGKLTCCAEHGCHKNKVVKINDDSRLCLQPATSRQGRQPLPVCMDMITVDHVVNAVLEYYADGVLPPIGMPTREIHSWYSESGRFTPENVKTSQTYGAA